MTIRDQTKGRPRPKDSTAPATRTGAAQDRGSAATTSETNFTTARVPNLRLVLNQNDELPSLPTDALDEIGIALVGLGNTVRSAARNPLIVDRATREFFVAFTAQLGHRLAQVVA